MKISLRRRHTLTMGDGPLNHKIHNVRKFYRILNLEVHPNRITGLRVTAIMLNGWSLHIGGVALGRVSPVGLRTQRLKNSQTQRLARPA